MKDVIFARCTGYAASEISNGAAVATIPKPMPIMKRPATYRK
jgi:hypothetical protein